MKLRMNGWLFVAVLLGMVNQMGYSQGQLEFNSGSATNTLGAATSTPATTFLNAQSSLPFSGPLPPGLALADLSSSGDTLVINPWVTSPPSSGDSFIGTGVNPTGSPVPFELMLAASGPLSFANSAFSEMPVTLAYNQPYEFVSIGAFDFEVSAPTTYTVGQATFDALPPAVMPEPGILSLSALGGVVFAWRYWLARKK